MPERRGPGRPALARGGPALRRTRSWSPSTSTSPTSPRRRSASAGEVHRPAHHDRRSPRPTTPREVADHAAARGRRAGSHHGPHRCSGWASASRGPWTSGPSPSGVAPNLGWRDARLGRLLAERLGPRLAVAVGNDADLAVLAELSRGSARGCDDVVYLIGRIGVGAGIVVNGVAPAGPRRPGRRDRPQRGGHGRAGVPLRQARLPGDDHRRRRAAGAGRPRRRARPRTTSPRSSPTPAPGTRPPWPPCAPARAGWARRSATWSTPSTRSG